MNVSCSAAGLIAALFGALTHAAVHAEDWMQFRGPRGMGVSHESSLPVKWDATTNLAWKTELPGAGASSPIVVGDRIFLTCYSGYGIPGESSGSMDQLKRSVVCLQRGTGKLVWAKEVPVKLPEQATIREGHGYATGTPVSDGQNLFVFFGKSGAFAFDLNGRQLWQADVGSNLNGWGSATSPVLFKNLVLVNASVESESLIALDKKTGKEVWRTRGIRESWNTPIIVETAAKKPEVVLAIMGKVLGFEPTTGNLLWSCATDIGWYMVPSLVAQGDVVYCIGGRGTGGALAVRTGGHGDVTASHRLWIGGKGSNVSSPVIHDGHLYWAHESLGIAYCADLRTGSILYEQRLDRAGQVYASPIIADGKLVYTSRSGRSFVLAARPRFEQLAVNDLRDGSTFNSSPAVSDGQLLLRSDKYLYCIGDK